MLSPFLSTSHIMLATGDGALLAFPGYELTDVDPLHRLQQTHSFVDSFPSHPVQLPAGSRCGLDDLKPYPMSSCFSAYRQTSPILMRDVPRILEGDFHISEGPVFYPDRHRDSVSSSNSSGSSFSVPDSPVGSLRPAPSQMDREKPLSDPSLDDDEGPWNLVSYHVPWGSAYEGYEAGTLPGPDGRCIFLRSPTPSKKQRTSQACDKCRERKAKCSGARPVCARCDARGHLCVYAVSMPPGQDVCPGDPALPSPSSEQVPTLLKLSKTSSSRTSRKDSIPESDSSLSDDRTPERSPGAQRSFGGVPYSDTAASGPTSWSSSFAAGIASLPNARTTASVRDIYAESSDFPAPSRGSTHAFSNFVSDADRLYIDSSGLDEYRFPPVGEIKAFDVVHTQPLAPPPPHQRFADPPPTGCDLGYGWLSEKADIGWANGQPVPRFEMNLEFSEPLSAAATHSFPTSNNTYSDPMGGTAGNYSLRSSTSHTLATPEGTFIGPEFATEQFESYGERNDYDIGWIPSEKS